MASTWSGSSIIPLKTKKEPNYCDFLNHISFAKMTFSNGNQTTKVFLSNSRYNSS